MNGLGQVKADGPQPEQYRLEGLPDASGTLLTTEYAYTSFGGNFQGNYWGASFTNYYDHDPRTSTSGALNLHGQPKDPLFNYVFADAHVEFSRPEDTVNIDAPSPQYTGVWTIRADD